MSPAILAGLVVAAMLLGAGIAVFVAMTPVGDPNREHAGWVERGIQKAIEAYEATRG